MIIECRAWCLYVNYEKGMHFLGTDFIKNEPDIDFLNVKIE